MRVPPVGGRCVRRWLAGARPGPDGDFLRRFAETRDGAALSALVDRHGPMVLAVARRATSDHHAAEDVFQAAFLTLDLTAVRARKRRERAETVTPTRPAVDPLADLPKPMSAEVTKS